MRWPRAARHQPKIASTVEGAVELERYALKGLISLWTKPSGDATLS
jgi:hypothetical protein